MADVLRRARLPMSRLRVVVLGALIFVVSCSTVAPAPPSTPAPPLPASPLPCFESVPGVTWMPWTASGRETLDHWCASVGPPVVNSVPAGVADLKRLLIVTWNVHVGGGQLEDFVAKHWTDREHTGLVLLLQEVYRAGAAVPPSFPQGLRVPDHIRPGKRTSDITAVAKRLGLSMAYVPSMRNGPATSLAEREDRGNAILSTEPLADVRAIELPFGKQRRVAVAATITPRGSAFAPIRVIATHFDNSRDRFAQAEAFAGRIDEFKELPLVIGGDFNSRDGVDDAAVRSVGRHIPMEACGTGKTSRFALRLDVVAFFIGRLDFIFSSLASTGLARDCRTLSDAFHSDHLPVLLTVQR